MGNETKCYKNIELLEKRQQNKYNKRSSSRHSNSCNNNNNNEANAAVTAVAVKVKETVPSERVGSSNQATCCFKNSTDRERPSNNVCWFFLFYFFLSISCSTIHLIRQMRHMAVGILSCPNVGNVVQLFVNSSGSRLTRHLDFKAFGSRSNSRKGCVECRAIVRGSVPLSCGSNDRCCLTMGACLLSQFIRFSVVVAIRQCTRSLHNSSFFSSQLRQH